MCGICGRAFAPVDRDALRRAAARMRHRGPDQEGVFAGEDVMLGHRRLSIIDLSDDGRQPIRYETSRQDASISLNIGDPDVMISGSQRYRISYRILDGLNPQSSHDEFYWNVTGNDAPVGIESASATVAAPQISDATCFQGALGSTQQCDSSFEGDTARPPADVHELVNFLE